MSTRVLRPFNERDVREHIRAKQIVNRLTSHALGRLRKPMDASQVAAALGLLRKVVPDLSAMEHSGEVKHSYVRGIPEATDAKTWAKQNQPTMQ